MAAVAVELAASQELLCVQMFHPHVQHVFTDITPNINLCLLCIVLVITARS